MAAELGQLSLADLAAVVGTPFAREANPEDAVDGVQPRFVVTPGSAEEVSEVLATASRSGLAVVPRGGGTKLHWGNPPSRLDLILSTERLNRLIAHEAGDLVVIAQAGMPLAALQEAVAGAGQMLAIDPPRVSGTLGGTIAANASGPMRLRYGTMRDLVIGITVVLPDGTVAKSGGKVVKNVAGYDLGKLFTGSLGTLGVIVETIFRLHPTPAQRRAVVLQVPNTDLVTEAIAAILHSTLVPVAIELRSRAEGMQFMVVFAGIEPSVVGQADAAAGLLSGLGATRILGSAESEELWQELHQPPWREGDLGLKISTLPTRVADVLRAVREVANRQALSATISGHAAGAVLLAGLSGEEKDLAAGLIEMRERLDGIAGSVVALEAPPAVKRQVDVWGPAGDALPVMQRMKEQFDPLRTMSPGRFVGGI